MRRRCVTCDRPPAHANGSVTHTRAPPPGAELIRSSPPSSFARSSAIRSPQPAFSEDCTLPGAIMAEREGGAVGVAEFEGAGEGVGPDRKPVQQVGGRFHHDQPSFLPRSCPPNRVSLTHDTNPARRVGPEEARTPLTHRSFRGKVGISTVNAGRGQHFPLGAIGEGAQSPSTSWTCANAPGYS